MLVVHERGVRQDGCTVVEGLRNRRCRIAAAIVFVPAGHKYHHWHEPRTLSRVVFSISIPPSSQLSRDQLLEIVTAPRLFFEDKH